MYREWAKLFGYFSLFVSFYKRWFDFLAMYVDSLRRSSRFEDTKKLVKAEGSYLRVKT